MRRLAIGLIAAPLIAAAALSLSGTVGASDAGAVQGRSLAAASGTGTPTTAGSDDSAGADASAGTPVDAGAEGLPTDAELAPVDVLQVSGLFDGTVIDAIDQAINRAVDDRSQALILQVSSGGAVASADEMRGLLERVATAPVPIGIWVGPSGDARLYGTPAQLMGVADVTAMVSGSRIGHTGPLLELAPDADGRDVHVSLGAATDRLRNGSLSFQDARELGALRLDTDDLGVPTIRSMVLAMDGVVVHRLGDLRLDTVSEEVGDEGEAQLSATLVRFAKLGLIDQLMHTMASPPVAYLMFVIGVALLIFELFTAGVGVAGVVGAVCTFFGCYGLAELPARGWAVGLLVAAMVAYAIDVQVGIPRLWTGVGIVLTILGSWFLYSSLPGTDLRLGWLPLLTGVGGLMLTFIVGMPSMVRTRFATPTIGREWMIGQSGTAVSDVDPDGQVLVGGGRWRARTNRATPVPVGGVVKVVAIDGVTLEVEPETGGARDYRERRPEPDAR